MTLAAVAGVRSVAQVRVRAARALGASRWQVLWFVVLPSALPEILTGIRIGLGVGWSTLVAAELLPLRADWGLWRNQPVNFSQPM